MNSGTNCINASLFLYINNIKNQVKFQLPLYFLSILLNFKYFFVHFNSGIFKFLSISQITLCIFVHIA